MSNIMIDQELRRKQQALFELLCAFDRFAKRKNINYFISAGTLLGAVKYNNFIPWDDDLDIYIRRADFEKIKKNFCDLERSGLYLIKVFFNDRLVCKDQNTWSNFLDISVLDNCPDSKIKFKLVLFFQLLLRASLYDKIILNQNTALEKINFIIRYGLSRIVKLILNKKKIYFLQSVCSTYFSKSESKYLYLSSSDTRYLPVKFSKKWFERVKLFKFNSKFFPGSAFYKEYLCQQYGDIQKLPPLELQRPQHLGLSNFIFDYYQDDGF